MNNLQSSIHSNESIFNHSLVHFAHNSTISNISQHNVSKENETGMKWFLIPIITYVLFLKRCIEIHY